MPQFNAYAADPATIEEAVPEYSMPRGTYAAPDITDGDAYIKEFGWSAHLRTSAVETPSAQRLGVIPRYDDYPDPRQAPDAYWDKRDADNISRHNSQEAVTGKPWNELQGIQSADTRWAPNPRLTPPPLNRITQLLSPGTYSFTRPFDQYNRTYDGDPPTGTARHFTGWHFSMADHKRMAELLDESVGSMPVRTHRNTYRTDPTPWDTNVIDMPADQPIANQIIQAAADVIPDSNGRSWRLM